MAGQDHRQYKTKNKVFCRSNNTHRNKLKKSTGFVQFERFFVLFIIIAVAAEVG